LHELNTGCPKNGLDNRIWGKKKRLQSIKGRKFSRGESDRTEKSGPSSSVRKEKTLKKRKKKKKNTLGPWGSLISTRKAGAEVETVNPS